MHLLVNKVYNGCTQVAWSLSSNHSNMPVLHQMCYHNDIRERYSGWKVASFDCEQDNWRRTILYIYYFCIYAVNWTLCTITGHCVQCPKGCAHYVQSLCTLLLVNVGKHEIVSILKQIYRSMCSYFQCLAPWYRIMRGIKMFGCSWFEFKQTRIKILAINTAQTMRNVMK